MCKRSLWAVSVFSLTGWVSGPRKELSRHQGPRKPKDSGKRRSWGWRQQSVVQLRNSRDAFGGRRRKNGSKGGRWETPAQVGL